MTTPDFSLIEPWIGDLIKIGIPSLVTLLSLFLTYKLGMASHKKDLALEKLRAENIKSKASAEKKAELAKEVMLKIVDVEHAFGKLSGLYRIGLAPENNTEHYEKLCEAYKNLGDAIDASCAAQALVHLFGDEKVSALYELFLERLFTFQREARPVQNEDKVFLMMSKFDEFRKSRAELVTGLSSAYIGNK